MERNRGRLATLNARRKQAADAKHVHTPTPEGRCLLCGSPSREGVIEFVHVRLGSRVTLAGALCETCGNQMEKHLKRVVAKAKFTLAPIDYDRLPL